MSVSKNKKGKNFCDIQTASCCAKSMAPVSYQSPKPKQPHKISQTELRIKLDLMFRQPTN